MNTKEVISTIKYNPHNKKLDTTDICHLVCWYKYDIMDKIDTILSNPDYHPKCDDNRCILVSECERDSRTRCCIEVVRDDEL